MKSGFVSIVGRPNTGKSTLINTIINSHIAILLFQLVFQYYLFLKHLLVLYRQSQTNLYKSVQTLINSIINSHIAIVSNVAGTTRNTIQGVYHDKDASIINLSPDPNPDAASTTKRIASISSKDSQACLFKCFPKRSRKIKHC